MKLLPSKKDFRAKVIVWVFISKFALLLRVSRQLDFHVPQTKQRMIVENEEHCDSDLI